MALSLGDIPMVHAARGEAQVSERELVPQGTGAWRQRGEWGRKRLGQGRRRRLAAA